MRAGAPDLLGPGGTLGGQACLVSGRMPSGMASAPCLKLQICLRRCRGPGSALPGRNALQPQLLITVLRPSPWLEAVELWEMLLDTLGPGPTLSGHLDPAGQRQFSDSITQGCLREATRSCWGAYYYHLNWGVAVPHREATWQGSQGKAPPCHPVAGSLSLHPNRALSDSGGRLGAPARQSY